MSQHQWFDQDLLLANIFLYLQPDKLFNNSPSSIRNVSQSWNSVICGEEFCKYYFVNSYCCSSEPFINNQNCNELFDSLDSLQFDYVGDNGMEDDEEMYDDDDDVDEDEEMVKEKPIKLLTIQESVKQFEHLATSHIGNQFSNLNWKNNFYQRFLTLIAYVKRDSSFSALIESLLKPLDDSKLFKLNNLLKKWKLSTLLTNVFKINQDTLVFFNDNGIPYALQSVGDKLKLDNILIMDYLKQGFVKERVNRIIPQLEAQQDQQVFCDVLCGLFPHLVEQKKKALIKRPVTAYLLFCSANRNQVKQDNPTFSFTDLAKHMGGMWKDMSDDEKQIYIEQANQEKLKYQQRLEEFVYCISGLD